jgi:hypothetical protein
MISSSILKAHPSIEDTIWKTLVAAVYLDEDIRIEGLFIRVTKAKADGDYFGWAYPDERTWIGKKSIAHPGGRIDLRLGVKVSKRAITTLFAHELRHIGQFHRGRKKLGFFSADYLDDRLCETDCFEFEKRVLETLRIGTHITQGTDGSSNLLP